MEISAEFLKEELKGVEAQANEQGVRFQQALGACGVLRQLIAHAEKPEPVQPEANTGPFAQKVDDLAEVPDATEPDN